MFEKKKEKSGKFNLISNEYLLTKGKTKNSANRKMITIYAQCLTFQRFFIESL